MPSWWLKIALGIVGGGLLLWGISYLWNRPEQWNGTAKRYRNRMLFLQSDSTRRYGDSVTTAGVLAQKDSAINLFRAEAQKSLEYGQQWQARYQQQVAVSDATADRLTDRERELAYYKALQKNGTLTPYVDTDKLQASAPEVIRAGLKTATREEIAGKTIDTLMQTVGRLQAANNRLGEGLSRAGTGLIAIARRTEKRKKGGVWPFNKKRRRQLSDTAGSMDSLAVEVQRVQAAAKLLQIQ